MNSKLLKKALPHVIAILVFLLLSIAFNKTAIEGKILRQSDVQGLNAMAKKSDDYKLKNGHWPLWTESVFSGMPALTIRYEGTSSISIGWLNWIFQLRKLHDDDPNKASGFPIPIGFFFSACVCFYILAQTILKTPLNSKEISSNFLISVLGSVAYAYATFNPILASVGHETQLIAIGYLPAVIAGILLILNKKYWIGTATLAVFFTLEVSYQHIQILYYSAIIIFFIVLFYLIFHWKSREYKHFAISSILIVVALTLGLANYAYTILPNSEYAKETMRGGKSQLTSVDSKNKTKGGLNKDYAFSWSYGLGETLTLFVPGMQGGGTSGKMISANSKFSDKLMEVGMPEDAALASANQYAYWGDQPFTSGPVYLGAVVCFLFILGLVYVKDWHKWWIVSICILGVLMAWGRHFSTFNYFLFDHLPFYNKFRAPSMSLVMPQLGFIILGILGLQNFVAVVEKKELNLVQFKKVIYIGAGLIALSLLVFFVSDFKSDNDTRLKDEYVSRISQQMSQGKQPSSEMISQATQTVNGWISALHEDRKDIFQTDLIRSIFFLCLAAGTCWFFLKRKIKPLIFLSVILVLCSFDILSEATKYLNEGSYSDADSEEVSFVETNADRQILADKEQNFRVLDLGKGDPFQDPRASYFHNSVGGYHPAKLALYNDLIEHQLIKGNQMVYNMLNTKYIIQKGSDGQDMARLNSGAFGPCWLVSNIHFVKNADEEMAALDSINVRDTAIVENIYKSLIPSSSIETDSLAFIKLDENLTDNLTYSFKSKYNQFAVFSEIFYDKGWTATIDGKIVPICKVDYVLRGLAIPAGEHKIEFHFSPTYYTMGNSISTFSVVLTYLILIVALLNYFGIFPKKSKS